MGAENEFIVYGGPVENKHQMLDCKSLAQLILRRLREMENTVVLIDATSREELTAAQLLSRSVRLAMCLRNHGIKCGDIISIYSENRFEMVELLFACIYLGVALGLTYVDYTDEEFKNTVALLRPKIIFTSYAVLDKISKLARDYDCNKVVVFGEKTDYDNVQTYSSFFDDSQSMQNPSSFSRIPFVAADVDMAKTGAIIMRTSGTTSAPKSVQMSQQNLLCAIWEYVERKEVPNPFVLSCLPWVRPFGLRLLLRQMMHGIPMVFLRSFKERAFLDAIETYRPNTINLYVTTLEFLAKNSLVDQYDLSSIKVLFSCSAPLDVRTKMAIHQRLGIPFIHQGYGMSEFGTIADQSECHHKIGSVGVLRRGVYGKVIDLKSGQSLGPYERGHLMFKGPNVMMGYLYNDAATRQTIDEDGWLRTGDYGYYDTDGEWFLIDRIKDLVQCNGQIIPPAEIERVLKRHPQVGEVAVIGIANTEEGVDGELPAAYVVRRNSQLSEKDLNEFIRDQIDANQRPHFIRFIKEIPADAAGKPSRLRLRQMAQRSCVKF